MKLSNKLTLGALTCFGWLAITGCCGASAVSIDPDDIPNRSYVVGAVVYTRATNDHYNGYVSTEDLMMAANTIEGFSIDDMDIYYKNAHGSWVDGITGESVETPEFFNIIYKDNNEEIEFDKPTLSYTDVSEGAGTMVDFSINFQDYFIDKENADTALLTYWDLFKKVSEPGENTQLMHIDGESGYWKNVCHMTEFGACPIEHVQGEPYDEYYVATATQVLFVTLQASSSVSRESNVIHLTKN